MSTAKKMLKESIAALAMGMGSNAKHARAYHSALADEDGYMGFYGFVIDAAHRLEEYVQRKALAWGYDVDFYLATEHLSDKLLDFLIQKKTVDLSDAEWEML